MRGWRAGLLAIGLLLGTASIAHAATGSPVLERGNGPEPATLDAHRCPDIACANILRDLYEGLVTEDAQGRAIPGMATHWTVSEDGLLWTFHLRDGLRWSNGEPLDAGQIVASFRRAFAPDTAAPHAALFDALHQARAVQAGRQPPDALGVAAPDPRTVVFRLERSAPMTALLSLPLAFPLYLPAIERHGRQHARAGTLVGNGPYRLEAWTPQAHLRLARNPHFHAAGSVRIDQVRYHVTEDASAELQRFAAGDLHITETVPPLPLERLRARFGGQLRIAPYIGTFWLGLNLTRPPFDDATSGAAALREALSLAIDRDILTRHVTGLGETPAWGVVPPGIADAMPARLAMADATQAQREARARALYREAGYSDARPLRLELRYNTSTPHRRLALAVAAMWRQTLGVQTRLRNEEWKVFVGNRRQRVITQVFRGGWIADLPDPRNFLAGFADDGPLNWSGFDDATFRALIAQADAAPDAAARARALQAAEQRLLDRHALIPVYFYASKHLVAPQVGGFEPNALDRHPSRWLHWIPAPPDDGARDATDPP